MMATHRKAPSVAIKHLQVMSTGALTEASLPRMVVAAKITTRRWS